MSGQYKRKLFSSSQGFTQTEILNLLKVALVGFTNFVADMASEAYLCKVNLYLLMSLL